MSYSTEDHFESHIDLGPVWVAHTKYLVPEQNELLTYFVSNSFRLISNRSVYNNCN